MATNDPFTTLVFSLWAPWALAFARVLGMALTAPAWGTTGLGWRIRLGLAGLVTLIVAPAVGPDLASALPTEPVALGRLWIAEAAVGGMLGMTMALVIAGARQAGEIVGGQAGLSAASLFDPEAGGAEMTPLGHLYGLIALGTFLALDGPLRLVGALIESYRAVPPGGMTLSAEVAEDVFGRVGQALALALGAAAPVALALVLAGLALGLLAKAAPSFQFLSMALPVRSAVGLVLVLLGLGTLAATLSAAWLDPRNLAGLSLR